ncbi:AFG1-like ATPase [Colletotrichum sp. SAR 10_86]|nr:AFG1-like ATPase [Colletotrichum sp. SAR 10_65]KAI8174875.1 AFG1-like ATPase [Colletotrichum sp. SAR 10_75]KAI8200500.1 AFG1-like ATPase [Colletotrichum sp. SAR 10_76]KAI8221291.1 AFG1-like ATPase [Colletotrichum sp. SAR 10_77]KAI8221388.1 AFG1-like ATPase [Colletotrichum sp. SAR 10_86]
MIMITRKMRLNSAKVALMSRQYSTAMAITDPLVKYRTLISTKLLAPDPSQHRLAIHLQKLYTRLKDYAPEEDYRERLKQVADIPEAEDPEEAAARLAMPNHPIWDNPLFKHVSKKIMPETKDHNPMALVRVMTSLEGAITINSPRGLFLSGEVGVGKSMLIDLLAQGLPTEKKRRWHFNTFMLYTFSQLEKFRRSHPELSGNEREYSMLWLAKKLVEESPILFLDEFQLPDRAASKILSHLFIAFFHLGGVLIASSNRMPEELQKAIGVEYTVPPSDGFLKSLFLGGARSKATLHSQNDFAAFLEVLKARCDFWHMEGATDFRRRETGETIAVEAPVAGFIDGEELATKEPKDETSTPSKYFLLTPDTTPWTTALAQHLSHPWSSATLTVYGRTIPIPRQYGGVVYWDFDALVATLGPADYVTMASTYHTFIIDNVPTLTALQKNEARRFITLLDALYEARCKLFVRAQTGPDDLFFPDIRAQEEAVAAAAAAGEEVVDSDAIHSETIAEVYQDSAAPFRPNISFYDTELPTAKYDPDQDSDFGKLGHVGGDGGRPNFSNTAAFTGEDERFAYRRAASRLWELCSEAWHARGGSPGEWWTPVPRASRHWENSLPSKPKKDEPLPPRARQADAMMGPSRPVDGPFGTDKLVIERREALEEAERRVEQSSGR